MFNTKEDALNFLSYHAPTDEQKEAHEQINRSIRVCLIDCWDSIPAGPGKILFVRALNDARMKANSAIANNGL